jgi:hypothetical protein
MRRYKVVYERIDRYIYTIEADSETEALSEGVSAGNRGCTWVSDADEVPNITDVKYRSGIVRASVEEA